METIKAEVINEELHHYIRIELDSGNIDIPISKDEPNEIKSAFNKLILRIKKGVFQIKLNNVGVFQGSCRV